LNNLSPIQLDALAEVFNIGAGRAAASLSEIVNDEVRLSVPRVEIRKWDGQYQNLIQIPARRFGAVSQQFSGPFNAEAILLFSEDHALEIVKDMMGSQMGLDDLAEFEQEAMCELGNIILNACLSAMADMLKLSLNSSLPSYRVAHSDEVFINIDDSQDQSFILILHIDLEIERRHSKGQLLFVLSSMSLQNLVTHIDLFLGNIE
jgi:chemotaxis protein CheC